MTEQEAIEIAIHCLNVQAEQEVCEECPAYAGGGIACREVARTAISALKEIQQYRKIGTVEECREYKGNGWIPVKERLPETDDYILLSFSNFSLPMVGRYEEDSDGGAFYLGDCDEEDTCISQDLFVNAWMPLPEPYREEREDCETE